MDENFYSAFFRRSFSLCFDAWFFSFFFFFSFCCKKSACNYSRVLRGEREAITPVAMLDLSAANPLHLDVQNCQILEAVVCRERLVLRLVRWTYLMKFMIDRTREEWIHLNMHPVNSTSDRLEQMLKFWRRLLQQYCVSMPTSTSLLEREREKLSKNVRANIWGVAKNKLVWNSQFV